jgi:TonB family protein
LPVYLAIVLCLGVFNLLAPRAVRRFALSSEWHLFGHLAVDLAALGALVALIYLNAALGPLILSGARNAAFLAATCLCLVMICYLTDRPLHSMAGSALPREIKLAAELTVVGLIWQLTRWVAGHLASLSRSIDALEHRKVRVDNLRALGAKPEITAEPSVKPGNVKEEIKEPVEPIAQFAPLPQTAGSPTGGWNFGGKPGEAEGARAGGGNASVAGNVAAGIGTEGTGGGGGSGLWGLGRGYKGNGTGGGGIAADALTGLARPMGGYQVKPRYPDSARRAGFQGTTLLKVHVLENGRVGEVLIEQSAGHRDLDTAAADAVKQWLFEAARMGERPIAVWVLLPVKFELQR